MGDLTAINAKTEPAGAGGTSYPSNVRKSGTQQRHKAAALLLLMPLLVVASIAMCSGVDAKPSKSPKTKEGAAAPDVKLPSAENQKESAYPAVDKMERFLFNRAYVDEDAETRLNRLDKEVFGDPVQGTVEERMAKLDSVLAPRMREKEDAEARVKAEAEAQQVAAANAAAKQKQDQEAQDAASRAKIAAQAAREQEIKNLLSEAANLWRSRKGPEALERFDQVLRLDPQNGEALFSMGVIEESRGKLNEALTLYQQAAKAEQDNSEYSDAVAAIEKKIKAGGGTAQAGGEEKRLRDAATAAFKRAEYFSALDLYKQLDEKVPNQAFTKFNIGTVYLMLKDHYNALDYYKQAHKLAPGDARFTKAFTELDAELQKSKNELAETNKAAEAEWNPPASPTGAQNGKKTGKEKGSGSGKSKTGVVPPGLEKPAKQAPQGQVPAAFSPQQPPRQTSYPTQQPPQQRTGAPPQYQPPQQAYPPQQAGYPPQQPAYPPQQPQPGGYPSQPSYPPRQTAAPYQQPVYPQQPAYQPPQQTAYPPQPSGYPPQQPAYPTRQPSYPPQQTAYPPQQGYPQQPAYQPQQPAYPPQQTAYPSQPAGYPPQQPAYPPQQPAYPPQQPVAYAPQQPAYPPQQTSYAPQQPAYQPPAYTQQPPAYSQPSYQPVSQPTYTSPYPGNPAPSSGGLSQFGIKGKGTNDGVMVTSVQGGSRAARAGLTNGDVIRTVDGNEVTQPSQLEHVLSGATTSSLQMLVFRNGNIVVLNF